MSDNLRFNCLKFSLTALLLLFLQTGFAQGKKNDREYGLQRFESLDSWLAQSGKQLGNDLVTLVAYDTIVFKKEMGDFNSKAEAPLGAASSWLTAALIMVLVDEGKLSLDDKVSDHLPVYASYGKNYITLRHCLSHFTGIQPEPKMIWEMKKAESLEVAAASFAKREIQTNPGTESRLSNIGPILAGRIAEAVMKKKFDQLIKTKLFNPMGMTKTSFSTLDGSAINPAGGARSTPNDMIRFLQMLLNNGKFNGKQVLSEDAVKELRKVQVASGSVKGAPKLAADWGMALGSWVLDEKDGEAGALAAPGFYGLMPIVDWCRGYVAVLMTKNMQEESKGNQPLALPMREAINEQRESKCGL